MVGCCNEMPQFRYANVVGGDSAGFTAPDNSATQITGQPTTPSPGVRYGGSRNSQSSNESTSVPAPRGYLPAAHQRPDHALIEAKLTTAGMRLS